MLLRQLFDIRHRHALHQPPALADGQQPGDDQRQGLELDQAEHQQDGDGDLELQHVGVTAVDLDPQGEGEGT